MRNIQPYLLLTLVVVGALGAAAWLVMDTGPQWAAADTTLHGTTATDAPAHHAAAPHAPLVIAGLYADDTGADDNPVTPRADTVVKTVKTERRGATADNNQVEVSVDLTPADTASPQTEETADDAPTETSTDTPAGAPANIGFAPRPHVNDPPADSPEPTLSASAVTTTTRAADPAPAASSSATPGPVLLPPPANPTETTETTRSRNPRMATTAPATNPAIQPTAASSDAPRHRNPRFRNIVELPGLTDTGTQVVNIETETRTPISQLPTPAPTPAPAPTTPDPTPAPAPADPTPADDPDAELSSEIDSVISWFTIGWSGNRADYRHVGRNLDWLGWGGWVARDVHPQVEMGVKRIMLHNPFGTMPGEVMQMDQYLSAQATGHAFLTEGFVEAWKPITDQGVEVIAYIGCGTHDPDFENLDRNAWFARAFASTKPLLDAGMSIALDAGSMADIDSHTFAFAEHLRSRGVKVYTEAKPGRGRPHWWAYNVISLDGTFLRDDVNTGIITARERYGIPNEWIEGDICRITRPRIGESAAALVGDGMRDRVREIVRDGHVAVTDLHYWLSTGRTFEELFPPESLPSYD